MQKYKFASVLLVLVTLIVCTVPSAFSAEKGAVHSEEITDFKKDDAISIPVKLENAKDLMGFKLTFTPSGDEVKVVDIKSGELTQNGLFNHNADIKNGSFDVVWTSTEKIGYDGVICYLQAECVEDFEEFNFLITYSQPDTFNENFDDVELDCKSVKLKGIVSPKNTDVIIADAENISISEIAEEVIKNDDSENIINKIDVLLEKYNYDSINDVKDEHIQELIEDICKTSETFDLATENLENNDKIEVLKEIYNSEDKVDKNFITKPVKENNIIIIILPIGILIMIIISVLLIKRRKKA